MPFLFQINFPPNEPTHPTGGKSIDESIIRRNRAKNSTSNWTFSTRIVFFNYDQMNISVAGTVKRIISTYHHLIDKLTMDFLIDWYRLLINFVGRLINPNWKCLELCLGLCDGVSSTERQDTLLLKFSIHPCRFINECWRIQLDKLTNRKPGDNLVGLASYSDCGIEAKLLVWCYSRVWARSEEFSRGLTRAYCSPRGDQRECLQVSAASPRI